MESRARTHKQTDTQTDRQTLILVVVEYSIHVCSLILYYHFEYEELFCHEYFTQNETEPFSRQGYFTCNENEPSFCMSLNLRRVKDVKLCHYSCTIRWSTNVEDDSDKLQE